MNVDEKRRRAAELRMAGVGYEQIAEQVGYAGPSGAYYAVQEGLEAEFREPTSEIRRLELERLDALLVGLWAKARRGDVAAIDRVLKVMDRRARYLGLDTGVHSSDDGKDVEVSPADELRARRRSRGAATADPTSTGRR